MTGTVDRGIIRVNPAPVLTLWAAVVAERLGHPPDTALSLASAAAGTAARAKARQLGLVEEAGPSQSEGRPGRRTVRLLGKEVPLTRDVEGRLRADAGHGQPAPAAPVEAYLSQAFGPRLPEVKAALESLAACHAPEDLNRIGFGLYQRFRPEVPSGAGGWAAKGALHLEAVRQAGEAAA
jgi:hypothetical protein